MKSSNLILILVAILVIVVGASLALIFFTPESSISPDPGSNPTTSPQAQLDLQFVNSPDFQARNRELIDTGSLPVMPPATTGKANPFL